MSWFGGAPPLPVSGLFPAVTLTACAAGSFEDLTERWPGACRVIVIESLANRFGCLRNFPLRRCNRVNITCYCLGG